MMQNRSMAVESGDVHKIFDDDGRPKRTGTFFTASSHIITAVIGSGVLSLAWCTAQLGWVAGPSVLMAFSLITYTTSIFLADCYRSPAGDRNYTYMGVVRAYLGGLKVKLCGIAQYSNLLGISIGYTITASISMVALSRSTCYRRHGRDAECPTLHYPYMITFGITQIILSQIPNFHKLSWLSVVAAVMSFAYSSIGVGLSITKLAGSPSVRTRLTGTIIGVDVSASEKLWRTFQAIGNMGFAYAFSTVLVEIQDTVRSPPPENKAMNMATLVAIIVTTIFYVLCGTIGYAAFGNDAPGNFLNGFGHYEPFWLIDFAHIAVTVHLIGAYQVFAQPLFGFVEAQSLARWPESKFITREHAINIPFCGSFYINLFRMVWRTFYVIVTSVVAMIFPFFNDILGLLGAGSFYPLTVYFPIEMHIEQAKIPKFSHKWIGLKLLSLVCLVVCLMAAAGSIKSLVLNLYTYKPFHVHE